MMQYLVNALVGGLAFLSLTAILVRLNHLSWRTHVGSVVGMHVGMAIMCVLAFYKTLMRPDLVGLHEVVSVVTISIWVYYSLDEWVDNRPPMRFRKDGAR